MYLHIYQHDFKFKQLQEMALCSCDFCIAVLNACTFLKILGYFGVSPFNLCPKILENFDIHLCFKVELCERRAKTLLSGQSEPQRLRLRDIFKIKGGLSQKFLTYIIKNMYADLACTGLKPGEELRVSLFA